MDLHLIGDCHLGRVFKNDVPLNRRGEREAIFQQKFVEELRKGGAYPTCVQVGDLFDKAVVSLETLLFTMRVIREVAGEFPNTQFLFMAGNHDISRQSDRTSCFEVLTQLLKDVSNVRFALDTPLVHGGEMLLIPFSYGDFAEKLRGLTGKYRFICTHEDESVLIANRKELQKLLAEGGQVLNGHIHLSSDMGFFRNVGSLLPLAHGEDGEEEMFLTLAASDLPHIDPALLKNMCVRIRLEPGEVAPDPIDCLQWKIERVRPETSLAEVFDEEVSGGLNVENMLREKLTPLGTFEFVWDIYQEKKLEGV